MKYDTIKIDAFSIFNIDSTSIMPSTGYLHFDWDLMKTWEWEYDWQDNSEPETLSKSVYDSLIIKSTNPTLPIISTNPTLPIISTNPSIQPYGSDPFELMDKRIRLQQLPIYLGAPYNDECPICRQSTQVILSCGHAFCQDCILDCLEQRLDTCGYCRKPFTITDLYVQTQGETDEFEIPTNKQVDDNSRRVSDRIQLV